MDNYKIKVKDEADSKEAQELFFALGVTRPDGTANIYHSPTVFGLLVVDGLLNYVFADSVFYDSKSKELTLPQLRDLVVLKRNDINDATHTDGNRKAFLDSAGEYHYWCFHKNEWIDSKYIAYLIQYLKPIQTAQAVLNDLDELREEYKDYHKDPALISGADALRALADGKDVQVSTEFTSSSWDNDTTTYTAKEILAEETAETDDYNSLKLFFRLKPQTIKVELELPKPFEPKNGEIYWFVDSTEKDGYLSVTFHDDKDDHKYVQFGAYRTEAEVKQVVEQLRKIRGAS